MEARLNVLLACQCLPICCSWGRTAHGRNPAPGAERLPLIDPLPPFSLSGCAVFMGACCTCRTKKGGGTTSTTVGDGEDDGRTIKIRP